MIRDLLKKRAYFDKWINYEVGAIQRFQDAAQKPTGNRNYRPQFVYEICVKSVGLLLKRYSRGDAISELSQYIPLLLDAWEEAERLGKDVWTEEQQYTRHAWKVNLDHYINCFWLIGLALALDIPDDQWSRLVALVGNEGEDALLDRVIASRQPGRRIGTALWHPKPYQRLLDAVLASPDKQSELLRSFVDHWYTELDRPATKTMPAMYNRPYWYKYHELEGGYFGYWCIEAVAAVKAFGMDDSLCLGHSNYPGDLLRPDGSTTLRMVSENRACRKVDCAHRFLRKCQCGRSWAGWKTYFKTGVRRYWGCPMIRSQHGDRKYWNGAVAFSEYSIAHRKESIKDPSGDPEYRPQYIFELARDCYHLMFERYSRGDAIAELAQYFPSLLNAWEESERLGKNIWTEQQQYTRHAWKVNLDHYIVCFWLIGLALALEIPDDQWQRLLVLIGNEGEDALLDRVIASRQPGRRIGSELCHPKPYQRLLNAVLAPSKQQPELLRTFVEHWYAELDRPATKGTPAMYARPYWYRLGDDRGLDDSGYFGRWCVEAVAAVKAFGLDDTLCLGHPNYPGDLLRPDGPTTHRLGTVMQKGGEAPPPSPPSKRGFLAWLLNR